MALTGFSGKSLAESWGSRAATSHGSTGMLPVQSAGGYRPAAAGVAPVASPAASSANLANEQRLAKMLQAQQANYQAETKARYEKLMGLAGQFGAAQQQQSGQMLTQQMALGGSDLIDRGLGNSSVVNAVNQNAQDMHQRRLTDIGERQAGLQMGVINDHVPTAPDLGMYAQLFSQARSGGGSLVPNLPLFSMFAQPAAPPAPVMSGGKVKGRGKVKLK